MARVLTNTTALAYAIESSQGVLPGSPSWKSLEPNGINSFGAEITTVARSPISKNRQRRKGTVVDLTPKLALAAGTLSLRHSLPMADAIILATAQAFEATLWTQDAHFKGIEGVKRFAKIS